MATWGMEESCWAVCAPVVTAMARILALAAISGRGWCRQRRRPLPVQHPVGRRGRVPYRARVWTDIRWRRWFPAKRLGCRFVRWLCPSRFGLAGGDGKPIALLFQALQAGQGFGEQSHVVVVGIEIVRGIGLNQGFLNVFADVVGKAANDAGEAVSDERADLVGFGERAGRNRQAC